MRCIILMKSRFSIFAYLHCNECDLYLHAILLLLVNFRGADPPTPPPPPLYSRMHLE